MDEKIEQLESQIDALAHDWCIAVYNEAVVREFSFTNKCIKLHGFRCKQFTIRHYIELDFNENFFIKGVAGREDITPEEVANHIVDFLWCISTKHTDSKDDFEKFDIEVKQKIKDLGINTFVDEINDYLEKSLMDMPKSDGASNDDDNKAPTISYYASLVDSLALEYHWTDEYILDLPWARILQYLRAIEQRKSRERGDTYILIPNKLSGAIENKISDLQTQIAKIQEEKV